MKKFIVLCIFFIFCIPLYAQWSVGGKIGPNWAKVHLGNNLEDPSFKMGLNGGLLVSYSFSRWFDIQGELIYSGQGYKEKDFVYTDESGIERKDLNIRYNYLCLPLLLKFYPLITGLNAQIGIHPGYLGSKSIKLDDKKVGTEWIDSKPSFDCGLLFGIGYIFQNGFFLDGRYILGFIQDKKCPEGFSNRTLQLSVGYIFSF